jgi:aryl-alcohol dehydrogenase-like predicted oxidoreductase
MQRRELGRSGIEVTRLILGCGNFGGIGSDPTTWGKGTEQEEAFAIMDAAWRSGIRTFDTASSYGGGRSEETIGRWRAARDPNGLLLTSKAYWPVWDGDDRGLAPARLHRVARDSLRRFGVECIDLYLLHEPDSETPLAESLRALDELRREGVIRAFGVSNVDAAHVEECLRIADEQGLQRIEFVQNEYSLLVRDAERELLPLCAREGLGFTPFSPLAGGWLAGRYRRGQAYPADSRMALRPDARFACDDVYDAVERLEERAGALRVDAATLAFAWVLANPHVTAALVGPSRVAHLGPPLRALELELSAEEREDLAALFTLDRAESPG